MKKLTYLAVLACAMACTPASQPSTQDASILESLADQVVIHTYQQLAEAAHHLHALASQSGMPTEAQLQELRESWILARAYWEQSEGFLFGPVDYDEIDPALDSWPLDQTAVEEYLASQDSLSLEGLQRNPEARGFHLLEYLLWGEDGKKTAQDFTSREWTYFQLAAADFAQNTQRLVDAWTQGEDAFGLKIKQPGNETYDQAKTVYLEFVEGMAAIAAEMVESKIGGPLQPEADTPLPQEQESYYSDQSKGDLLHNLNSIRNIYNGSTDGGVGLGIGTLILNQEASLDRQFRTLWQNAYRAVEQLPDSFTEAITNHRSQVLEAQAQVAALHELIENKLLPLVASH